MKVKQWVDFGGGEVAVDISTEDIAAALAESFAAGIVELDQHPSMRDVVYALNSIGGFLNAITDEQIAQLSDGVRATVGKYFARAASRFAMPVPPVTMAVVNDAG